MQVWMLLVIGILTGWAVHTEYLTHVHDHKMSFVLFAVLGVLLGWVMHKIIQSRKSYVPVATELPVLTPEWV